MSAVSSLKDFEIIKDIGKGSFATVSIVKRKVDDKIYAMKKVKISTMGTKEKENALNEVRLLASINNRFVIGYKEAFFDDETQTLNIIMEFADDEDLDKKIKQRLKSQYCFKEEEVWFITIQIMKGLKALHDKCIMHRDLKSANIFMNKAGEVKIGDLNVSKLVKEKFAYTQTGTPYYASPEVWKDTKYDYKADIWSVGCIVYEMCCLKTPFKAKGLNELFEIVCKGKFANIPSIYSKDLSILIQKMLKVDENERISCDEFFTLQIVKNWIHDFKKRGVNLFDDESDNENIELLSTIKLPNDLKLIRDNLPKHNYNDSIIDETESSKKSKSFGNNDEFFNSIPCKEVFDILVENDKEQHNKLENNKNENEVQEINLNKELDLNYKPIIKDSQNKSENSPPKIKKNRIIEDIQKLYSIDPKIKTENKQLVVNNSLKTKEEKDIILVSSSKKENGQIIVTDSSNSNNKIQTKMVKDYLGKISDNNRSYTPENIFKKKNVIKTKQTPNTEKNLKNSEKIIPASTRLITSTSENTNDYKNNVKIEKSSSSIDAISKKPSNIKITEKMMLRKVILQLVKKILM